MSTHSFFHKDSTSSTLKLLLGIWGHLSRRRRVQLSLLLLIMLVSGASELVSLGSVLPFLMVLNDPELLWQQPLVHHLFSWIGLTTASQLLLPTVLAFALAALLAALIRITNLWLNGRLAAAVGSDLSCEAYKRTLYQPYSVHIQRNSSAVITGSTIHVDLSVGALNSLLQLITAALVAVGILIGLFIIDASVALAATSLFATAYMALAVTTRSELQSNSNKIAEATSLQLKAVQEGLGSIRDVLLDGTQSTYVRIYRQADRPQRQFWARNVFLGAFPRYAFEALGMVAFAFLGGALALQGSSGSAVIPLLGAMALGAQRLLPSLQQVYTSWTSLKANSASLETVLKMLNQPLPPILDVVKPLPLSRSIRLENLHFRYEAMEKEVLNGVNVEIRRGECIGLIGKTGSGKSTMADLLMGLFEPTKGRVLVDGIDLHDAGHPERLASWRSGIAHVPQSIYLFDGTIAENIAFGVPRELIDYSRVREAAALAQISGFIDDTPKGYQTLVGERGVRLSGGQRQRIGMARALYKQASLLVLDEATSALDVDTELAVMCGLFDDLKRKITILIIAHRLSTLMKCDRVMHLSEGAVLEVGARADLINGLS